MRRKHNELKLRALSAFSELGPLAPPEWAVQVGFYPVRAAYSYLSRLWRWGMLLRQADAPGRVSYSLSVRGRERLAWLVDRERKRRRH